MMILEEGNLLPLSTEDKDLDLFYFGHRPSIKYFFI